MVNMDFWLLKLLSENHENKKKQTKITQQTAMKNNRKVKAMGNKAPIMDHYPRNGQMGDADPYSCMSC